jgi:hypothetical protein
LCPKGPYGKILFKSPINEKKYMANITLKIDDQIPKPGEPEPDSACWGMDEFPANPPNPPLSKGGQGGFLKFGGNLRAISFLRD